MSINTDLLELKLLKDGWYDGDQGRQLPTNGLDRLSESWSELCPTDIQTPHFFPTADGGIQAEWSFGCMNVVLHIDLENYIGRCHIMDMTTGTDVENDEEILLDLKVRQE
jgi:hypothetical protein